MVRVLIVDDHLLFADAVRAALEDLGDSVVAVVPTATEAIAEAERSDPDVILMDLHLPDQSGLLAGRTILERDPSKVIIALTGLADRAVADEALAMGFRGYITKDTPVSEFVDAVRSAHDGHLVLPHRLARASRDRGARGGPSLLASTLTPREKQVLSLLVQGKSGRDVALELGVSLNTIRTHVQSILTKLQVHSRFEAATFAVRNGIVDPPGA
jgi:two-component system nitrate/nitrite response regulator NarL